MKLLGPKLTKYSKFCGLILGVLIILSTIIYGALPYLFESFLHKTAEEFGLGKLSGSIRRVSLTSLDLNSITLGSSDKPYASVSSITADYSLLSLLRGGKSESLVLSGAEINCSYNGKSLLFPGLDVAKILKKAQALRESNRAIMSVIEVKNSVLNINYCGKNISIPFKLKYFPNKNQIVEHIELELSVREHLMNIKLSFNKKSTWGTIHVKNFEPEAFYDFSPEVNRFFGLLLSDISLNFTIENKRITGTAKTNIKTPFWVNPENNASISIPLSFKYSADFAGNWEGDCESHIDSVMLKSEKMPPVFSNLALFASFSGLKGSGSANLSLSSSRVSIPFPSGPTYLKNTNLCTSTQFNKKSLSGEISLTASSIEFPTFQTVIKSPVISLPFKLPTTSEPARKGSFSMSNISVKDINIRLFSGELQQIGNSIAFSATMPSIIFPNIDTKVNGKCEINKDKLFKADLFFNLPKGKVTTPVNLGKWIPSAAGITYKGEYELEGSLKLSPSGIGSNLKLNISNSDLEIKSKELTTTASGISLKLELKDIFKLKSAPSQLLKISKLSLGPITIEDIFILFHIEKLKSILIENIHAKWCDGNISVQAMRINPTVKKYSPVISCDRVSFSQVIEQLNIGKAEGEGTLNGTIPLIFKDDKIKFDNGFLYSTPGNIGKIKIEGGAIDSITEGIPKDNPQFTQLSLSQMALRDFDYEWAKLYLNTEGENVIAKIQINGKPTKPLPFAYKKEYGSFVSVEANSPGSVFQGLKLDINIKLPFNKFMWYNTQMQKLIK